MVFLKLLMYCQILLFLKNYNMGLLEELNSRINDVLNEISPEVNETIYNLIQTNEGRILVVDLVETRVLRSQMSIGEAINSIAAEYDINGYFE